MQDKIPNHAPIPTELNIAHRGKSWLHGRLIDGEHGYPTKQSMEGAERAALAATPAAAPVVPDGWVPCVVTYEGQHPEEVAYGPQIMMDRLKKWLERYFELKAAAPVVLPEPTVIATSKRESPEKGSVEFTWGVDALKEEGEHKLFTEQQLRALLATATGLPAQAVLDYPWRDRLLDGRALVRDQQGFAEHSELPLLDEGMKPRAFFAALGIEMKHTMADDDLSMDEYDAMSDAENWSAWMPRPPIGDAWSLVAIFDTEDGPAAWWARAQKESREAEPRPQADVRDAERLAFVLSEIRRDGMDALSAALHDLDGFPLDHQASVEAIDRAAIAAAKGE